MPMETCLLLRMSHLTKTTEIHTPIHKVQILTGSQYTVIFTGEDGILTETVKTKA